MEKPKSITQLNKEQLEDMCLNMLHVNKVKHDEWDKTTTELLKERLKWEKLKERITKHLEGELVPLQKNVMYWLLKQMEDLEKEVK